LSEWQIKEADILLRPEVPGVHWSDFGRLEDCLQAGENAVREKLEEIRGQIRRKKIRKFFSFPLRRPAFP
jgi:hypothetical protein